MRVLYHYDCGPDFARRLAGLSAQGLDVSVCPEADDARFRRLLPETEVLWHCLRPVDQAVFQAAPCLRLVQKIGVGVNTIDLECARSRGVAVCNMPGTNSAAVAEASLALMLAVLRQLRRFDADLRAGRGWSWDASRQDRLGEIAGRTIGLVGYGAVPRVLAPILTTMGARVVYSARDAKTDVAHEFLRLDDLLAASDVVSLHVPATPETHHLIDARRIARMRRGAILVNTARGSLVDEAALIDALDRGHLAGAGLDVFAAEPVAPTNPLLKRDDVVLSPHVAWLTRETLERSVGVAVENCHRLANAQPLRFRVV
jgi:phosphoglycerate dehydrogenase-like enzyme